MFLLNKRVKGKFIKHPLLSLFIKMNDDKIDSLLEQLKSGNKYVIEEIVRCHMKLAISIASKYAIFVPNKSQDLVSEAILTLINCCHDCIENLNTKIILTKIHEKLAKFIKEDTTVRIPSTTQYRNKIDGQNLGEKYLSTHCSYCPLRLRELKDLIEHSIKNSIEKQIVELRSKEYTDYEISEMVGLSRPRVTEIRNGIYERFRRLELC